MKKNIYLFALLIATYSSAQKSQIIFSKKNIINHVQSLNTYNKKYIKSEADKRSFLGIYEVTDSISPQVTDYNNNPYRTLASIPETEHFEFYGYCIPDIQTYYNERSRLKGCVLYSLVTGKFYQMRTEAFDDETMYYESENMHPWKWVRPELPANIKAMMVRYRQYVKTMGLHMDAMVVIQHKYMTKFRQFDTYKCSKIDRVAYNKHIDVIEAQQKLLSNMTSYEDGGSSVENEIEDTYTIKTLMNSSSFVWHDKI